MGGFVIHQDMKDAMTRQQQMYAAPAVSQPTGNPVYNATHDAQGNVLASAEQSSIVNAPVVVTAQTPSDFWVNPAARSFEAATAQPSAAPQPAPASSEMVIQSSNYWTDLSIKPVVSNPAANELKIPAGQTFVPNSIKVLENGSVQYATQPKITQSDLSVSSQLLIGLNALSLAAPALIDKQFGKNTLTAKLAGLEYKTAGKNLLYGEAGVLASIESEVYGTASLLNSAKVSLETKQLQYAPVKTPLLAPTVSGSLINSLLGDSTDSNKFQQLPVAYQMGAVFGEAGLALIEGEAAGLAFSKTSQGIKIISPKIDAFAEATLGKAKTLTETGLNKIQPGLGKATETIFSRDLAKVNNALGLTETKINSKIVNPVKMKVFNPIFDAGLSIQSEFITAGQRMSDLIPDVSKLKYNVNPLVGAGLKVKDEVITIGQRSADLLPDLKLNNQLSMYMRSIAKPNMGNLADNFNLGVERALTKGVLNPIKYNVANPIIDTGLGFKNEAITAGQRMADLIPKTKTAAKLPRSYIIQDGLFGAPKTFVNNDAFAFSKMTKAFNNNLRSPKTTTTLLQIEKEIPKVATTTTRATKAMQASVSAISGLPKNFMPYPNTRRNRTSEAIEIISYPTSKNDLKVNQPARLAGTASSFASLFNGLPSAASLNKTMFGIDNSVSLIPEIRPSISLKPSVSVINGLIPQQITKQTPTQNLSFKPAQSQRYMYGFPQSSKFEGSGPNMFFPFKSARSRKALRIYPVMNPKKLLE